MTKRLIGLEFIRIRVRVSQSYRTRFGLFGGNSAYPKNLQTGIHRRRRRGRICINFHRYYTRPFRYRAASPDSVRSSRIPKLDLRQVEQPRHVQVARERIIEMKCKHDLRRAKTERNDARTIDRSNGPRRRP